MQTNKILKAYFQELSKKSMEARIEKYGAEGFKEFMRKIGKKGGLKKKANYETRSPKVK